MGLAFEIHDTYSRKKELHTISKNNTKTQSESPQTDTKSNPELDQAKIEKLKLEIEFYSLDPLPSFYGAVCYCYCYIGVLTGPYFKFRTYKDWLVFKNSDNIDTLWFIYKRGKFAPFIIIGYLLLSKFVSFQVNYLVFCVHLNISTNLF